MKKIKLVVVIALMFPFVLLFSYWGYLTLDFFLSPRPSLIVSPATSGFRALIVGSAVGFSVGTIIGYKIGKEE